MRCDLYSQRNYHKCVKKIVILLKKLIRNLICYSRETRAFLRSHFERQNFHLFLGMLIRRPFGEITNFQSPTSAANSKLIMPEDKTPSKAELDSSGNPNNPQEEEALTPLANLKMLIRVASETEAQPSRRELFKEDSIIESNQQTLSTQDSISRIESECREYTELLPQR